MFVYFPQELSEATSVYVDRLNVYLQSLGNISLRDVVLSRRNDPAKQRLELTLDIIDPGTAPFRASYFSSLAGSSVDAQVAAFFALNEGRIHFIKDVSETSRRWLDQDAVLVIWSPSYLPNSGYDRGRPVLVRAAEQIAPGASGTVRIESASGALSDPFQAINRSGLTWASGGHGYAQARPQTGTWDAYPSCCDLGP